MQWFVSGLLSVFNRKYGFNQRLIAFLLAFSFLPAVIAGANYNVSMRLLPVGENQPILRGGDCGSSQALCQRSRRGAVRSKRHLGDAVTDDNTIKRETNAIWAFVAITVGSVMRPTVSIASALFMIADMVPAEDFPHESTRRAVISIPEPEPDAVFTRSDPTDFLKSVPVRLVSKEPRKTDWGNGHIVITDPADFPRIRAFDHHEPNSLLDNMRPNFFGQEVTDDWDFYNLINTDRPDFTDATFSVGKGVTIIESGYTFTRNNDSDVHTSHRVLPEVLARVGITDELELRVKWFGYVMTDVTDQNTGFKNSYFGGSDLYLGFKYEVLQQNDWIPMVTFLGGSTIPTGTGGVSAGDMQPFGNVVLGWGLRRWLYLKASTGVDFLRTNDVTQVINGGNSIGPVGIHGPDSNSTWHQSVSLLYQATKRVGGFLEWFSFFSDNAADNRAQHYADAGLFVYLTTNVQLDVRIGERLSDRVDGLFSGAGLSVRF